MISRNRTSDCVFKANNEGVIHLGQSRLSKVQFREISSFYNPRGVFFVVYAKAQSIKYNGGAGMYKEMVVDPSLVRPLVLTDIVVRAKKK